MLFYLYTNLLHNQTPSTAHILFIALTPVQIAHLSAWQCGVGVRNGDIMNPKMVNGAHKRIYK